MSRKLAACALPLALLLGASAHAAVVGEKVERQGPDSLVVSWSDADPVDVYVADSPDAGLAQARLVSGKDRDGRFETQAGPARRYFLLKDGGDGAVVRVAERGLTLEQGSNFRDVGGYPAAGGKRVRWGHIYRSAGTPLLSPGDLAQVQGLGLTELVDLRSSEERALAPTRINGVRYTAVGYSMASIAGDAGPPKPGDTARLNSIYARFPTLLAPQLRALFEALLEGEGALAYNCSAGQDRTGFATAMVLSALGVPRDVIFSDYQLSAVWRRPEYEMPKFDAATVAANPTAAYFARFQADPQAHKPKPLLDAQNRPMLLAAFEEIERRWGSVDAYLDKELGVDAADVARLRTLYLE